MQESSIETNDVGSRFSATENMKIEHAVSEEGFLSSPNCPYIIPTEQEAHARSRDPYAWRSNELVVKDFDFGRLGNRYMSLARSLRLGFCCKSRLVSTPILAFVCRLILYMRLSIREISISSIHLSFAARRSTQVYRNNTTRAETKAHQTISA